MNSAENTRQLSEFYRRDLGSSSLWILIPAAIMVFFGAPCVCFGAAVKGTFNEHVLVGVGGGVVLVAGLLLGFLGMARLVGEDSYVGVAAGGVLFKSKKSETFHAWSDITHVKSEPGVIVLEMNEDALPVRIEGSFGGLSSAALATRLEDWRRKSGWNLTPPDRARS